MHPRKKKNIYILSISVIVCIISVYFGASIYNANNNFLITHLNEMDKIYHYDVELVPALTMRAAISSSPFVLAIIIMSLITLSKTNNIKVKRLLKTSILAASIISVFIVLTILNPVFFEFAKWGYVWVSMGLIIIWANFISLFLKEN